MAVLNFAAETVFEANTTSGNVSLTRTQLETLVDGNYTTGGVALSGDNILALDVDLGNRIATKDLRYYFSSPFSTTAVASGISFYYRDYTTDPWSALITTYGAGYYTTTSGNFFPHQVRMIHTISGTSISGTVREYEVNSNEDIVDYGEDGTLVEKGLTDTPFGTSDPYTIPIYNDGDKSATAYVYIGNTGTDADDMLRLSDAQVGTYLGVDDGPLIGGDGYMWGIGSYSNTTLDNNKLILSTQTSVSYSSGWQNIATTLDNEPGPATIAWHSTDPLYSVIYYMHDSTMYKYELGTNTHISLGSTPRTANSNAYGGTGSMCHDPINNRIYYLVWDTPGGNYDDLYIYYFDIGTGLWSGELYHYNYGNNARRFTVRTEYFDYPGGTDSLDGIFEAGEKYILMCISTGHSTLYRHYALKISDNTLKSYYRSGFMKETGDYTGAYSACGVTVQEDNLDDYPTGTVAVIWAYAGSTDTYSYLNYYPITVSGGAAQNWTAIKHQNLPRDPTIDSWYYNDDFTNRADFFVYDKANNYVYMTSGYNNDQYAIRYELDNNQLWRDYFGNSFFDSNLDNSRVYGKIKYYEGYGNFWLMTRFQEEELWIYFPVALSDETYKTEGTYTSPILKNQDPTYWYVKSEIPENTQIATTSGVVAPTIEVRSSNTAPTAEDSHYTVMFAANPSDTNHIYPMGFDYDGTELWRDDSLGVTNIYYYISNVSGFCAAANKFYPEGNKSYDVNSIVIWTIRRASDNDRIRVVIYNRAGGITYSRYVHTQTYSSTDYWRPTNAIINANGNTYVTFRGFGAYDDRLSILTDTGWWIQNIDFTGDQSTLYSMCLAGEVLEDLWIIKEDENAIYRYSPNLTELMMIDSPTFQNANGICEDGAGGFWVGDYGDGSTWIRHYDQDGSHIATYDVTDHVQVVATLSQDYYGGVWLLDTWGDQVARFASSGTFIGKVALLNPRGLNSTPLGAYCMTTTYDDTYFIDMDVNLNKTVSHPANIYYTSDGGRWEGAQAASIDVSGYLDVNDAVSDPVWGTGGDLEWSEVGKDTHFLHHKLYHQARITLRSDSSDTPEVEKIALPPTVELTNIPMQGSKNTYLKTVVASGTVRSRQSGKLRTWFSVEE